VLFRYGELCGKWGKHSEHGIKDFSAYKRTKIEIGNDLIRMAQYDLAMGKFDEKTNKYKTLPNVAMLIWLGKTRLGQKDNTKISNIELFSQRPKFTVQIVNKTSKVL
jgi:hypothetical protein